MVEGVSGSGGLPPFPHIKVDPLKSGVEVLNEAWNVGSDDNWESIRDQVVILLNNYAKLPNATPQEATQLQNAANMVGTINSFWVFQSCLQTAGQQMGVSIPSD